MRLPMRSPQVPRYAYTLTILSVLHTVPYPVLKACSDLNDFKLTAGCRLAGLHVSLCAGITEKSSHF